MLLKDNRKRLATLIMAKIGGKEEPVKASEDGTELDESVALRTAGEELINAIHSKSPMGVVEAMKSLLELCDYDYMLGEKEEDQKPVGDEESKQP